MTIMDHTHIPDYNDNPITIEAADICIAMKELIKQSETFHAQFVAINSLTKL